MGLKRMRMALRVMVACTLVMTLMPLGAFAETGERREIQTSQEASPVLSALSEETQVSGEESAADPLPSEDTATSPQETVPLTSTNDQPAVSVTYQTHVSELGWLEPVQEGVVAGTVGKALSIEAFSASLTGDVEGGIEYRAHCEDIGWQDFWAADGAVVGTVGQSLQMEAIQIRLTGQVAETYDVYYRAHVSNFGWLGWAKNEEIAGSTGWGYGFEAIELQLVKKGDPAPVSTGDSYRPALWQVSSSQLEESTTVRMMPSNLDLLIEEHQATDVVLVATMSYDGIETRRVETRKSLTEISMDGFSVDFGTYGRFSATFQFYDNGSLVGQTTQGIDISASEYNIAPLSATFPVVLFSLSFWDISQNENSGSIPTVVMLDRPSAYDWGSLPSGMYAMPYLTESSIATSSNYDAFAAYVRSLHEINPDSKFNMYLNDITCSCIHQFIYANQIPEGKYSITLLSDGSATYGFTNEAYAVSDPEAKHQQLIASWNEAKEYAYETGRVRDDYRWHDHWDSMYAVLSCEPNATWWMARTNLFTSGDDGVFAQKIKDEAQIKIVNVATMLTRLQDRGEETVQAFKALYNFNDSYFADAEAQGKNAMMLLGTYVTNEQNFVDYANLTKTYYGDDYLYYYKGHPNTPTGLFPNKQQELEALGMTDVDSSVAAELILFFNPGLMLSGYGTSTFNSAISATAGGLFGQTKATALSPSTTVDYSIMDWFASPLDSNSDPAILNLRPEGETCYLIEFSDSIVQTADYDIALYEADSQAISFYAQSEDGSYNLVRTKKGNEGISYTAHVSDVGWQSSVKDGALAGTVGQARSMEALKVSLLNAPYEGTIEYRAHCAEIGWQDEWRSGGTEAGTTGQSRQMEAVTIRLTGEMAQRYDVYYRVHSAELGWLGWSKNGENAGTAGLGLGMQALEIQLVDKNGVAPGDTANAFVQSKVSYTAHVSDVGWQSSVKDGALAGTVGQARSMEALKVSLLNAPYEGTIEYRAHCAEIGWQDEWRSGGTEAGTTGQSRQMEAVTIRLTGEMAQRYDVYYRVHSAELGWLGWAKNGENAGTAGLGLGMQALEIQLVDKNGAAPGDTANAFVII